MKTGCLLDGFHSVMRALDGMSHQGQHDLKDFCDVAIVIGNQNTVLWTFTASSDAGGRRLFRHGGCDGQRDDERAAFSQTFASGLDRAAMHFHEPLRQSEPNTKPALGLFERSPNLRKHVKDVRQRRGGDAHARVLDGHRHGVTLEPGGQRNTSRTIVALSIFRRIIQEIREYLRETDHVRVEIDPLPGSVDL